MVREAESHAEEDKKRRALAESRNKLDNMIYTTEKTLKDYGTQLDEAGRKAIEDALATAKGKLESKEPSEMDAASEALAQASHKLAEAMYSKTRDAQGGAAGAQPGADGASAQGGPNGQDGNAGGSDGGDNKEDVVDADFKEVK